MIDMRGQAGPGPRERPPETAPTSRECVTCTPACPRARRWDHRPVMVGRTGLYLPGPCEDCACARFTRQPGAPVDEDTLALERARAFYDRCDEPGLRATARGRD